jgi:tetratricopeptide (TPR) repeat protein
MIMPKMEKILFRISLRVILAGCLCWTSVSFSQDEPPASLRFTTSQPSLRPHDQNSRTHLISIGKDTDEESPGPMPFHGKIKITSPPLPQAETVPFAGDEAEEAEKDENAERGDFTAVPQPLKLPTGKTLGQYLIGKSHENEKQENILLTGIRMIAAETELPSPTPDDRNGEETYFDYTVLPTEMRSAEFLGILPGVTAQKEVTEVLGPPTETARDGKFNILVYENVEGLGDLEIACKNEVVESLMLQLAQAFPAVQIAQMLESELKNIRSIILPDDKGNQLGQLFPEKGLTFVFVPTGPEDDTPMVSQIGIERVSAEPFRIRGEKYLTLSIAKARWDLRVAVMLDPNDHKAHWLLAKAYKELGDYAEAAKHCNEAIRLNDKSPQYYVTFANLIGESGNPDKARKYLLELLPGCGPLPHVKAQAECLIGDYYRKGNPPDYLKAIKSYSNAIETAGTLVMSKNPTQRQIAKEILLNAHLNTALTISGSSLEDKNVAIEQWLNRSREFAEDLVISEGASPRLILRVASTALAIYLESDDDTEIEPFIKLLQDTGKQILSQSDDPLKTMLVEKEMGLGYYSASQIFQVRGENAKAVKYGELAYRCLDTARSEKENVADLYRIARVCFRVGGIQAMQKNHSEAVKWYGTAIPYFQKVEPQLSKTDQPRLGEIYISIGVSYWEVGEKEYAIQISEYGVGKLEEAVDTGLLKKESLVAPYDNLALMYRGLEQYSEADDYEQKARSFSKSAANGASNKRK